MIIRSVSTSLLDPDLDLDLDLDLDCDVVDVDVDLAHPPSSPQAVSSGHQGVLVTRSVLR